MLYDAMVCFLEPFDIDVIRLCVADMNTTALGFYFKLGFQITSWSREDMFSCNSPSIYLLTMQKVHESRRAGSLPLCLRKMPPMFNHNVKGEAICIVIKQGTSTGTALHATIKDYDPITRMFTVEYDPEHSHLRSGSGSDLPTTPSLSKVCVNSMYARGELTFNRSPSFRRISPTIRYASKDFASASQGEAHLTSQKHNRPALTQGVTSPKRARLSTPGLNVSASGFVFRKSILDVSDGGEINVGGRFEKFGFTVRHIADGAQPGLKINDVILAVGGIPLLRPNDDVDQEEYSRNARLKLSKAIGKKRSKIKIVLASEEALRKQGLDELRVALDSFIASVL